MKVFAWLRSRLSPSYRANWFYRRALLRAKLHKNQGAIADYTVVIDMADSPKDLRAMALYNRALVYHAIANESAATVDLKRVLNMHEAAEFVKTEARRKLVRMERAEQRLDTRS